MNILYLYNNNNHFVKYNLWSLNISELQNLINLEVLGLAQNHVDGPIPIEGDLYLLQSKNYV